MTTPQSLRDLYRQRTRFDIPAFQPLVVNDDVESRAMHVRLKANEFIFELGHLLDLYDNLVMISHVLQSFSSCCCCCYFVSKILLRGWSRPNSRNRSRKSVFALWS